MLLGLFGAPAARAQQPVDLELVLAVDSSLSVNAAEFALQMSGLSQAFRSPAVQAAIRASGDRGIAVALMQWSDREQQVLSIPWTGVRDPASAEAFARRIEATARAFGGAGTAIGAAIRAALPLFVGNGFAAPRRVIDLSGDGIDNRGPFPRALWPYALTAGVTINGLAILNEDPYLDRYYEHSVIQGTGAFVLVASDYQDFARAILTKLVREISQGPVAQAAPQNAPDG